jgi:4-hydroxy-4-methyl-2-oxoglutarate aldolase
MSDFRVLAEQADTSAICDVDRTVRVMSPDLRCRSGNPVLCGPAVTVRCRDDFLGVVQAIEASTPGDVLIVDGGGRPTALAGELFARAALARGLAGLVVDGGYRDMGFIATCELPVYSRLVTPMAGTTQRLGVVNEAVTCGGVTVCPGDLVIGDRDGIVVLDPAAAESVLSAAVALKATESEVAARLSAGVGLGECVNLAEHTGRLARGEPSALHFTP